MSKYLSILGLFVCLAISSCYEPQEGCLDPLAVNYDVSADINANCTYPRLNLAVAHLWQDESFSYDSTYLDNNGNPFQIKFMGFFLRNFELLVNNNFVPVSEKMNRVRLQDGRFYEYPEEIVLVESRNFQSGMDSITVFDPWTAIKANIGLDALSRADSAALPSGHPLNKRNAMSPDTSRVYFDYAISFLTDTSDAESRRWIYGTMADTSTITFFDQRMFEPAMNAELVFNLYYDRLFSGLAVDMPDAEVRELWEANIRGAMELDEP